MSNLLLDHLNNLVRSLQASEDVANALADRVDSGAPIDSQHVGLTLRALGAGLKAQAQFIEVLQAAGAPRGSR